MPFCARLEETQSLILRPTKCLRDIPVQATFAPNPSLVRMQASATQHTTHHATHGTSHTRLGKVVVGFSAAGVRYVLKERVWRPTTNCGTAQMKIPLPLNLKIGVPRNKGSRVEPLAILFLKKKKHPTEEPSSALMRIGTCPLFFTVRWGACWNLRQQNLEVKALKSSSSPSLASPVGS